MRNCGRSAGTIPKVARPAPRSARLTRVAPAAAGSAGVGVPRNRREVVPASLGESVDARRSEESVAALAAQERAEHALRASEARYRKALAEAQAALNRSEALYKVTRSLVAA